MSASFVRTLLSALFLTAVVPAGSAMPSGPQPSATSHVVTIAADIARSCDDGAVLKRIISRFRHQVTHVPNLPDVHIVEFRRIHERRNKAATENWPIPRRYCGAKASMSDGRERDIWYLIEGGMGFATIGGDNVEFCVQGFDRWFVYNGRCRVVR